MRHLWILSIAAVAVMATSCVKDDPKPHPNTGGGVEVQTVAGAQAALDSGETRIVIVTPLTEDATVTIPDAGGESVSLTLDAGGNDVTVNNAGSGGSRGIGANTRADDGSTPDLLLSMANVANLDMGLGGMHVVFDGDVNGVMSVSASLLKIAESANAGELKVLAGEVHNHGSVDEVSDVAEGCYVLYPVDSAAELRDRLTVIPYDRNTNGGVVLTADIADVMPADGPLGGIDGIQQNQDLFHVGVTATQPQPDVPYDGYMINGGGFGISGAAYNNLLAVYADDVVIKNLTLRQTDEQKANLIEKDTALAPALDNGITVYRAKGITIENVTVTGCGKYGLVVNGSQVQVNDLYTGGNGWGGVDVDMGGGVTEDPELTLTGGNVSDTPAVVVETEGAYVNLPIGWTFQGTGNVGVWSPPAGR